MENLPENLTDKYSFFDNEYLLTKEMCAEAEISRIDTGLIIAWILFTFMLFMMMPFAPAMINDYFSAPSMGTIRRCGNNDPSVFRSCNTACLLSGHMGRITFVSEQLHEHFQQHTGRMADIHQKKGILWNYER